MAYRKPSIQLTQEFQGLVAALAGFNLTNCVIGPAFKVYQNDILGTYTGISSAYAYASQMPGTIVDTRPYSADLLRDEQYPVKARLTNVILEVVAQRMSGASTNADLTILNDDTVDAFVDVVAGDVVTIVQEDATVLPARTDGRVAVATPNKLETTIAGLFTDVEAGDMVMISAATDITAGTYFVQTKIDNQNLLLSSNFYTGAGTFTAVAYVIKRETGADNQGNYIVREKLSANSLKLVNELAKEESFLVYNITKSGANIELASTDYVVTEDDITVAANIMSGGMPVSRAVVKADYRALRTDLAANVRQYTQLSDLEAVFGVGEIVPANPLAYGMSLCLQNAVTPTNGLGLSADYYTNENLAYTRSLDVIKKTGHYVYLPLTQNPAVHSMFSAHVTQMSTPVKGKWRGAFCNRKLVTTEMVIDSVETTGFRTIVNTQTEGVVALGGNTISLVIPKFGNVQKGDTVVVVGGTGVTVGEYPVTAKNVNNMEVTLGGGFVATYSASDVEFYIKRADGLEANGIVFYDSNAQFITDGVAPGQHLVVETAGPAAGNFIVTSVDSQNKIRVAQVPGVTSVQGSLTYHIFRDLSRTEQAEFIKAYTESFRNRRLVHVWPDIVHINEGSVVRELPGYYLACAPVALTTGLPTHQGFTNLAVSGYTGLVHSSDYFDDDQLDTIASGGSMIFVQPVEGAALIIRHELTTDMSAIKYQEWMITKNVDYISYFLVQRFAKFLGLYNVYDGLFSEMGMEAQSAITFLKEKTVYPKIGGVIKDGSLTSLVEGATIDTVEAKFSFNIPAPLNNINITIVV